MQGKILLVEDEEITREGIDEFLTVKVYHVVAVGDGEEAIKVFESMAFDLVILDIMLPKADGKCGFKYHHTNKDLEWELMKDIRTEHITCIYSN